MREELTSLVATQKTSSLSGDLHDLYGHGGKHSGLRWDVPMRGSFPFVFRRDQSQIVAKSPRLCHFP